MSDYEQAVFISYAWKGESEEIVNQIDRSLQERGIKIIRDKRDLGYKGSISEFMERIGRGSCVIVVISDKYLRSPNCMFELVEIADGKQFHDRIFPVVLKDADIYDPIKRVKYVKYWEVKRNELAEAIKTLDPANLQGIREDMDLYDRIRDRISGLASTLKDMNTLTSEVHRDSDFSELYAAIEKQLKVHPGVPPASNLETAKPVESPTSAMNISASNNSIAIAGVDIQNVQDSNIHIGNIIYNTPNLGSPPELEETIDTEPFEPETILIPKGPFFMGSLNAGDAPAYETPQHTVHLPAYRIGKYPVTNSQYEEFVREKQIPVAPETGWNGQRVPPGLDNHPVTGVTWHEARDYCQWLSEKTARRYSLPNEAQWEKACRGGNGFLYPWGNELEAGRSNHGCESIAAVDAYTAQNEFGCFDLVGNVRQWTCSLWGEKRSQPDARYLYPWKDDQRNSLSANPQIRRVLRGSSMRDPVSALRCSARSGQLPEERGLPGFRHGFRVVMHIEAR
jgi:formylglycine-generating enzyme required for sulfatase activity